MKFGKAGTHALDAVPCPKCGAAAGQRCKTKRGQYQMIRHKERAEISPSRWCLDMVGAHSIFSLGKNPTGTCRRLAHSKCSGRHRGSHGLQGELCTCNCHAVKERRADRRYKEQPQ